MGGTGVDLPLTSRERMLLAIRNQQPDVVPVAPDMSNMIPCRLTGKPFWDIYLHEDPPLWKAYVDAVRHFQTLKGMRDSGMLTTGTLTALGVHTID